MLLNLDGLLFAIFHQALFVVRNDHVVDADGQAGAGGEAESQVFDLVEHLYCHFETEAEIAIAHQLSDTLLLQQAVDERHTGRKVIVKNGAAHGRVQERALVLYRFGMSNFLIVVGRGQVDYFPRIAQANRSQCFNFAGFEAINTSSMLAKARPSPFAPGLALVR